MPSTIFTQIGLVMPDGQFFNGGTLSPFNMQNLPTMGPGGVRYRYQFRYGCFCHVCNGLNTSGGNAGHRLGFVVYREEIPPTSGLDTWDMPTSVVLRDNGDTGVLDSSGRKQPRTA
jgi:hypothetical protein